jgi:ribonucleoside-diphosphate reductase alpha chain
MKLTQSEQVSVAKKQEPPTHSYKDALRASSEYFNNDELAANVWINKYALKDSSGRLYELTPDEMHRRMARELARIEKRYNTPLTEKKIYNLLKNFRYLVPQGGPMSGIGNSFNLSSLSNCFVIGNESDSYGGIMQTDEEQAQLMKRRGGVGHDLSHIRPKGSPVNNSALSSTGIVSFMERYSNSTREVAQGGRRGALMLSVSIKHPDAEDFIDAKLDSSKITGANISVRMDDDFIKAAISSNKYLQQYPVITDDPQMTKEIDASKLWKKIIHNAWKSAEPGILFWDTIIRESIPDCYADLGYKTVSTNPCGEIPLCPYDSCRLLAINLFSYVKDPFTSDAEFDFELFTEHAKYAQRVMDDIIDLEIEKINAIIEKINLDPESETVKHTEKALWKKILQKCEEGRRTGIGITAEGDMLAALGLTYGSDESIDFSVKVQKTLALSVYRASVDLARERGAFKIYDWEKEVKNPFIQRIKDADPDLYKDMKKYGRRNMALLTIAPTGSVSIMTQTTSGIEPAFMVTYKRRRKVNPNDKGVTVSFVDQNNDHWEEYTVLHQKFAEWMNANNMDSSIVDTMSDEELNKLIAWSPYHKATANDIDWVQKVKMQGAIQDWVDHSISVTVNVPNSATEDLVEQIYVTAWESGCKGITIYRDGSRTGVLVSDTDKEKQAEAFKETHSPKRPKKLEAEVVRFNNNDEKWIAVVGMLENKPYEVFTGSAEDTFLLPKYVTNGWVIKVKDNGKNRYDFQCLDKDGYKMTYEGLSRSFDKEFWNYAKLISGVLRHGMPLSFVIRLISGLHFENEHINTWKNGLIRALKKFVPNGTKVAKQACGNCGKTGGLIYQEGCLTCSSCGDSKCG